MKLKEEKTRENLKKHIESINNGVFLKDALILLTPYYEYKQKRLADEKVTEEFRPDEESIKLRIIYSAFISNKIDALTELDLTQNYILSEYFGCIITALISKNNIYKLYLSSNKISQEGSYNLGRYFNYTNKLVELDLSSNSLNEHCLKAMKAGIMTDEICISKLNLSNNEFTANCCPLLERLLLKCPYLKHFNISKNKLDNEFSYIIRAFILLAEEHKLSLQTLIAFKCNLDEESIKSFQELFKNRNVTTLKSIVLSDNSFKSGESCKFFFKHLLENQSIEELILSSCDIGNEEVKYITDFLSKNTVLRKLILHNNQMNDSFRFNELLALKNSEPNIDNLFNYDPDCPSDNLYSNIKPVNNWNQDSILEELDISRNKFFFVEQMFDDLQNTKIKVLDISQNPFVIIENNNKYKDIVTLCKKLNEANKNRKIYY